MNVLGETCKATWMTFLLKSIKGEMDILDLREEFDG